jgi:hypothetical protein
VTIRKLALVAIPAVLAAVGTPSIRVVAQVPGLADAGSVVVTKDGPVRGRSANGVNAYLGIPYAEPPGSATCAGVRPRHPPSTVLSTPLNLRTRVRR